MGEIWSSLMPPLQGPLVVFLLMSPVIGTAIVLLHGYQVRPLVSALLSGNKVIAATFAGLIAVSVAMGVVITAQERGLREGSARAAEKFDIVIAAQGSEYSAMLATVFLETQALPLLDGELYQRVSEHPNVAFAAPLAFGDSYEGAPVVGTTAVFADYLSEGLAQGRAFASMNEAILGAEVPIELGDAFEPVHGDGSQGVLDEHGYEYIAVGRMKPTGSPWDKAILVSVESVWDVHSLPVGHGLDWDGVLGPPFAADEFPGTPAILVRANEFWANYAIRSEFTSEESMAFFPGTVLSELYSLMGDVRQIMTGMAVASLAMVTIAMLTGLVMLLRILAPKLSMLRAIGAPERFVLGVSWSFATALIIGGAVLGLATASVCMTVISAEFTQRTDILISASVGSTELGMIAGFVCLSSLLSLLPAYLASRQSIEPGTPRA